VTYTTTAAAAAIENGIANCSLTTPVSHNSYQAEGRESNKLSDMT
jgi:hypothetical protein